MRRRGRVLFAIHPYFLDGRTKTDEKTPRFSRLIHDPFHFKHFPNSFPRIDIRSLLLLDGSLDSLADYLDDFRGSDLDRDNSLTEDKNNPGLFGFQIYLRVGKIETVEEKAGISSA